MDAVGSRPIRSSRAPVTDLPVAQVSDIVVRVNEQRARELDLTMAQSVRVRATA